MTAPRDRVRRASALAALLALTLAAASCGGSDHAGGQPVTITEVPAEAQALLTGDWPLATTTTAFLVRSDAEWQQAWQARRQGIATRCGLAYNAAVCAAAQPPAIDFTRYTLVGMLLDPLYSWGSPNPSRLTLDAASDALLLEYGYRPLSRAPFLLITGTRFFLVPRTTAALVVQARAE